MRWWEFWKMPAIRDLKGRPVDELVDSRGPAPPSVAPVAEAVEDGERALVAKAAREVAARRRGQAPAPLEELDLDLNADGEPEPAPTPAPGRVQAAVATAAARVEHIATLPLPEDFETAMKNLEGTLTQISKSAARLGEGVELAMQQIALLRARASKDQDRLNKLDAIEKALKH